MSASRPQNSHPQNSHPQNVEHQSARPLSARDRLRTGLATVLLWFGAALLVVMTALVLYQVFTRYVLGSPVAFTEELVRYALVWLSFVAGSYAFLSRGHMALVIVRDRLPVPSRRALMIAIDVLVLAVAVLVLGIGGGMLAWESRGTTSALLGISRGLVYLIVPLAGVAIALAQVLNILDDLERPLEESPAPTPSSDAHPSSEPAPSSTPEGHTKETL